MTCIYDNKLTSDSQLKYKQIDEINPNTSDVSEWDKASEFDKWTFRVSNNLLNLGKTKALQLEDLYKLSSHDVVGKLLPDLKGSFDKSKPIWFIPRLMVALFKSHKLEVFLIIILTLSESAIRILLPVILFKLLNALEDLSSPIRNSYKWAAILGGLGLAQTVIHHILFQLSMRMGWNWRSATTCLIYDRLFLLNGAALSMFNTGKLVNLISNDVARFEEFTTFSTYSWEAILEVLAILLILIYQLDLASALAGVGATLFFIPLQIVLAKRFAKLRGQTARATDQRVRYISEVIDGIGSVKSYGWEKPFFSLIGKYRQDECKYIANSQQYRAVNQGIFYCASPISSFITFLVFWANGNTLTLPEVFSTVALLQTLRMSVGRFWTRGVETGSEAIESCHRIEEFINVVDKQYDTLLQQQQSYKSLESFGVSSQNVEGIEMGEQKHVDIQTVDLKVESNVLLSIRKSSYYYGDDPNKVTLTDIEVEIAKGELVMIIGPVGSGKSSFLAAVLDEIKQVNSSNQCRFIHPSSRIAYCAQRPWILAASVRSNITLAGSNNDPKRDFKHPHDIDEDLYKLSVESCRIVDDMIQWPTYDDTEVGERGISISGGQKARIALARAVYSDSDLMLLDDPLSAVDAHVGKALFHDCIINAMKSNSKGILLATHQLQYLKHADRIIVLNETGLQTFYGSYNELISRASEFKYLDLDHEVNTLTESNSMSNLNIKASSIYNKDLRFNYQKSIRNIDQNVSVKIDFDKLNKQESQRIIIQAEDRIEGQMSLDLFYKYMKSGGLFNGIFALALAVVSQALLMITEYWLRWWASDTFGSQRSSQYVYILAILTALCIWMGFYRSSTWFSFTLRASSRLHEKCLWAVIYSPLQFFIANPTGRILNRFSRDTNQADELLPFTLFDFIQCSLLCLSAVILICVSIPWLILMLPLLLYCFYIARLKYISSAREIKRIDAVTRSPIYADFSATLEGLVTLRAYNLRESFTNIFQKEVDENGRAYFSFMLVSRWLGFRLDGLCSILLISVSILCVVLRHTVDVGLIGFALVYTMSLSGLFQWTVRQSAEVEAQMTAIERMETYSLLEPEKGYESTLQSFLNKTNSQSDFDPNIIKGEMDIQNLTVTYREDLEPVLKDFSITIPAGKKVGICGRTGSGKSSTLLALLRLNIIQSGDIIIDGKYSLTKMTLEDARSSLSIIPQDPHLFSGNIRFNLDPFSQYTDNEIWDACRDAHISDYLSLDPKGLLANVDEGGKNFSVGQRQLLSLARAILRKSRIVLMDEVTASIDYQTDKLIQTTIRTSAALKSSTIITVAHRLRTIADSDIIVVIDKGSLTEYGNPNSLLNDNQSHFYKLAMESNEFDDIINIASKAIL